VLLERRVLERRVRGIEHAIEIEQVKQVSE
jgi:hypothetical protein